MRASTVSLPERFLAAIVAELDNGNVVGILLGGSYARGDATEWSDVDFAPLYAEDAQVPKKRFFYREGLLVSVSPKTIAGVRAALAKPNSAIWAVGGIADCRVLLDKDGSTERLVQEARNFCWEPLQRAADAYASYGMVIGAESVHKLISQRSKGSILGMASTTPRLLAGLTETVAVQRGVLVQTESSFYQQVEQAVGPQSAWTRLHRLAAGVDEPGAGVDARAWAVLTLYSETVELLRGVMEPDHRAVAEGAVRVVQDAFPEKVGS